MNIPNSVIEDAKAAGFHTDDIYVWAESKVAVVYITEQLAKFAELTLARNVPEVSNQNDLVIVRRGDVESLKQEAIFGVFRRDAVEFDKLNALLANAPVVSGEPKDEIKTLREQLANGKRLLSEQMELTNERTKLCIELRAKVASADVLVEALSTIRHNAYMDGSNNKTISDIFKVADKVIMTYYTLSEVKHDTK